MLFLLLSILAFILGVSLLILGIILQNKSNIKYKLIYQTYIKVTGEIIGRRTSKLRDFDSARSGVIYPIVKYKTNEGEELILRSNIGAGNFDYRVGDTIEVYYDPQNPADAIVNIPASRYLPIILCGSFSFILLLFSVMLFAVWFVMNL